MALDGFEDRTIDLLAGRLLDIDAERIPYLGMSVPEFGLFTIFAVGQVVWYFIAVGLLESFGLKPKKPSRLRGWVLTASTAVVCLGFSINTTTLLIESLWNWHVPPIARDGDQTRADRIAQIFFAANCVTDLLVGLAMYPSEVDWLSGWVHHILYFLVSCYSLSFDRARLFRAYMPIEIPTLILAASYMHYPLRDRLDWSFGITFLIFRVLFVLALCIAVFHDLLLWDLIFTVLAWLMHVNWSYGWFRGKFCPRKREE